MEIRKAEIKDLPDLLDLYAQLSETKIRKIDRKAEESFKRILNNKNQYLLVADNGERICATITMTIIESLTHGIRSYAVVEHVITHKEHRGKGFATKLLESAKEIAIEKDCYKIMLITGRQEKTVHDLYKKAGFKSDLKTAYVIELSE